MDFSQKIKLIRDEMNASGIDAYIVPTSDPHGSEYLPEYYKTRQWVTGFTGSAGTAVITQSDCVLWTDGRYFIQAAEELKESGYTLIRSGIPGEPTLVEWLDQNLAKPCVIGFNGFQYMTSEAESILNSFEDAVTLDFTSNIIDKIWLNRPYLPSEKIYLLPEKYSGASAREKIGRIREAMHANGAQKHLISKLDDIAWALNLRGRDIQNNPFFLSYLFLDETQTILYVDPLKLNKKIIEYLHKNDVLVKLYEDLVYDLEALENDGTAILIEKASTPYQLYDILKNRFKIVGKRNPSTHFKAVKSDVELEHLKECYTEDGAAVVRFFSWLSEQDVTTLSELDVDSKITGQRKKNPLFRMTSFHTIAAYKDHGAIMHYRATKESAYTLAPENFLLIDSGGQYLNGTTDITRTIALGPLTDQQKRDFTLTLKSMLALQRAIFLEGATGTHLDTIARMPMWQNAMDYKSGTGHGHGFYLAVHEGPHRISMNPSDVPLIPGMVVTDEPGVYRKGEYGIRIENTLYVVPYTSNDFGTFFKFEPFTVCPIDLNAIDKTLLTDEETNQLNDYHKNVYTRLAPRLNDVEKQWLEKATRSL